MAVRVWLIPFSTNVERVSLALGHKGIAAEAIVIDPTDRSELIRMSGQELVPVAELNGELVHDSTAILRRLEELHPDPALWPPEPARRAELDVFIDWFNRLWKLAPNALAQELESRAPDDAGTRTSLPGPSAWTRTRERCRGVDARRARSPSRGHP